MQDPYDPTSAELENWCRTPGAIEPTEDWDLVITDSKNIGIIYSLAGTTSYPNWDYFLGCLYLFIGDAVRTEFSAVSSELAESVLKLADESAPEHLRRWRDRAERLISGLENFDYSLWCGGGYARQERTSAA
jgi:hypothetical protein